MNSRNLLNKVAEEERNFRKKKFLSHYCPQSKFAIVKMNKLHYQFLISGFQGSGVGIFEPINPLSAKFVEDADIETMQNYYKILPVVNVILAYETPWGWVSIPANVESFQRKFGETEVLVKNVSDAERFDVVCARYDGLHFWYEDLFPGANMSKSIEMRMAFDPSRTEKYMHQQFDAVKGRTPEDKRAFEAALFSWKELLKTNTEDQIKTLLSVGGGKLGKYVVRGPNIEIMWKSESGRGYSSLVNKETFDVVQTGICVSGEDKKFHLKDLAFLITKGENLHRIHTTREFDMEGDMNE